MEDVGILVGIGISEDKSRLREKEEGWRVEGEILEFLSEREKNKSFSIFIAYRVPLSDHIATFLLGISCSSLFSLGSCSTLDQ